MTNYKLVYFDSMGKAEFIRWMFVVAGVEYEDSRLGIPEWMQHKQGKKDIPTPFGQLPVLWVDGKPYCQTLAIAKYLAKKFELGGRTEEEDLCINQIGYHLADYARSFGTVWRERHPVKKEENKRLFIETQLPTYISALDKLYQENGGDGWMVGDKITWADMMFVTFIDLLKAIDVEPPWREFPELGNLMTRVQSHPRIADWINRRPVSAY